MNAMINMCNMIHITILFMLDVITLITVLVIPNLFLERKYFKIIKWLLVLYLSGLNIIIFKSVEMGLNNLVAYRNKWPKEFVTRGCIFPM